MGSMPLDEDEEDEECRRSSSKLMVVDGKNNSSSSKLNLVSTSQSKIYRSGDTISFTQVQKYENENEEIPRNVVFGMMPSSWDANHSGIRTNVSAVLLKVRGFG